MSCGCMYAIVSGINQLLIGLENMLNYQPTILRAEHTLFFSCVVLTWFMIIMIQLCGPYLVYDNNDSAVWSLPGL